MRPNLRSSIPAILATAILLAATHAAPAQQPNNVIMPGFQAQPNLALNQAAYLAAALGAPLNPNSPLGLGFNPFPQAAAAAMLPNRNAFGGISSTPYGGGLAYDPYSGGYGGGYGGYNPYLLTSGYGNSYGASLQGLADLTKAQGQYTKDWQTARMTNQQVEQAKLETRKQMLQLWQLERSLIPSLEEIRNRDTELDLRRARRDPPLTEILSAKSLNDLYKSAAALQAKGAPPVAEVKLDPDVLKKVTLTGGRGGNIGLLKNEGKLTWTPTLLDPTFEKDREGLEVLAADAVKKAEFNGAVAPATVTQMRKHLDSLSKTLDANINTIPTTKYIDATRYLGKLEDAITALEDPNVGNFFTQKWSAKGKTVAELVDYMRKNGLRFASAAPGEEAAYQALHSALASYEYDLAQKSSVSSKP